MNNLSIWCIIGLYISYKISKSVYPSNIRRDIYKLKDVYRYWRWVSKNNDKEFKIALKFWEKAGWLSHEKVLSFNI